MLPLIRIFFLNARISISLFEITNINLMILNGIGFDGKTFLKCIVNIIKKKVLVYIYIMVAVYSCFSSRYYIYRNLPIPRRNMVTIFYKLLYERPFYLINRMNINKVKLIYDLKKMCNIQYDVRYII